MLLHTLYIYKIKKCTKKARTCFGSPDRTRWIENQESREEKTRESVRQLLKDARSRRNKARFVQATVFRIENSLSRAGAQVSLAPRALELSSGDPPPEIRNTIAAFHSGELASARRSTHVTFQIEISI